MSALASYSSPTALKLGYCALIHMGTSGIHDSVITHSNYRLLEKYMSGRSGVFCGIIGNVVRQ